ncbi:MAG: glycosyltransferase family 4 protein, partial [Candidatus Paceibacteria bacterium]
MKIGYITPVRFNQPSGGNTRTIQFSNILSEDYSLYHFNIDTRNSWEDRPTEDLSDDVTEIDTAFRYQLLPLPIRILFTIFRTYITIILTDIDIIYVEGSFWHPPVIGWLCSRTMGLPLVISVDDYAEERFVKNSIFRWIINGPVRKFVLEQADTVILESDILDEDLKENNIQPQKKSVIPTGINIDDFDDKYPDVATSDRPTVFYVGRSGDLNLLFDSARLVKERISEVEFRIIGADTEDYPSVTEDYIYLMGKIYDKKIVYRKMAESHVCVVPYTTSQTAGRPVKLLEYMAGGKCIVATDFAYNTQMIRDQENGLIASVEVEDFANKICEALNDDELRARLGDRAREDILDYSSEKIEEKLKYEIEVINNTE